MSEPATRRTWTGRWCGRKKLISLSRRSGGARYFPYLYDYAREKLRAPWYSAYSQGFALSLFVRLYRVTGVQAWAERARETAMSFRRLGRVTRPWVAYVVNRRLWLEEYPSATPTHVLNGFNFALFGLYDYERLTRDRTARDLLRGALRTIRSYGTTYRVPGGISYYDLVHRTRHAHYHVIHTWQLPGARRHQRRLVVPVTCGGVLARLPLTRQAAHEAPDRASTPAIELDGIVKTFGRTTALDGLSLTVGRGELVGLLGPNGAGKTTAIKLLLGLARPTRGSGNVLGAPLGRPSRSREDRLPARALPVPALADRL